MSSVVYFIERSGHIKIGFTKDLRSRLSTLDGSSPEKLQLLGTAPGGRALEAELHERLASHRFKKEWFLDCPEVRSVISGYVRSVEWPAPLARPKSIPVDKPDGLCVVIEAAHVANHSTSSGSLFSDLVARFDRLVNLPLHDFIYATRELEKKERLAKGSLLSQVVGGNSPYDRYFDAFHCLNENHRRFTSVFDKSVLRNFHEDAAEECPFLRREGELLVTEAEGAVSALDVRHSGLLNSPPPGTKVVVHFAARDSKLGAPIA